MSDSAALEFTVDNQISRTFRSVDLSTILKLCHTSSTVTLIYLRMVF